MRRFAAILLFLCLSAAAEATTIPAVSATALDGQSVQFPRDLTKANVLIVGFSRKSADATTAWEKPVRAALLETAGVQFYDMPMLADAPGFIRPLIVRSIRKQVPDVAKAHFLPLMQDEDAWKKASIYDAAAPDAAYVLLVDRSGVVRWQTHEAFNQRALTELLARAHTLTTEGR